MNILSDFLFKSADVMKDYLDGDSRGMGKTDSKGVSYLQIPTPAWYPDSFMRSLKNSNYLKMVNNSSYLNGDDNPNNTKLEFYKESSGGNAILNALNNGVKKIVSVGMNQVMSVANKAQGIYDSVSSLFGGDDGDKKMSLSASMLENQRIPFLAAQPYIEVRGIHVTENVRSTLEIIQSVTKMADSAWQTVKDAIKLDFSAVGDALGKGNDAVIKAVNSTFFADGKDAPKDWKEMITKMFSNDYRLHGVAEQMIRQCVSGRYTMTCKIPLIANRNATLIQSSGQGGFKNGATGYQLTGNKKSDDFVTMMKQTATEDFNIGLSDMIKWVYDPKGEESYTASPVDTTFTIYNDTLEHFMVNYAFIFGFMSTTKATTDGFLVRAPYLYDIIVPGGVRYMLCTCDASVKCVGKMRRLTADTDSIGRMFNNAMHVPINGNSIEYIPDAYEVRVKFKSALPDLWNFIEAYINMNTQSQKYVPIGTEISSTLATFAKNLVAGVGGSGNASK